MATIRDILEHDVGRDIDGVIKAADDRRLKTEVEEYVITRELRPKLENLLEEYNNPGSANGVWISGFFGSGKSHLLKMLAYLLENRDVDGISVCERFLTKKEIADDAFFRSALEDAAKIPSKSILFNIDQKADAIGGDPDAQLLEVFAKVLNETQGFYEKQDYIAHFERGLWKEGNLDAFKAAYEEESGSTWEEHLDDIDVLENDTFARTYATFFNKSEEEGLKVFDRLREKHRVSVEEFASRVKGYLDTLPAGTRINFFVDEAGQFIGRRSRLMLNLQTIAEALAVECDGRAWIFVTSQGDIEKVIGELDETDGNDFTKIMGRFSIRPNLTSANVSEVIQKRLLTKTDAGVPDLEELYLEEKENLRTLFSFGDGSRDFNGFESADHFVRFAPFHPYQFDLFQTAIERLSQHNAFTGKHASVGERSMLSVFQEVAKHIADLPINTFATFDLMFEGLSNVLRGDFQRSVKTAEKNLKADHPLAVRILKSLFLLKYVSEFVSTPRNVAILLIDRADIDIAEHDQAVKEELNFLYHQHYLQKNGDAYEFLTDEEKDIEVDIKNTPVGGDVVNKLLDKVLFGDVVGDSKIRFDDNGQDYAFGRKLDSGDYGRVHDLCVHMVTAGHDNAGDLKALMAQNTGKRELLVILPNDRTLVDEAELYEQTATYVRQKTSTNLSDSRRTILLGRGNQNADRRRKLTELGRDLIAKAEFVINGSKVEVTGSDPRVRVGKAFQELIRFVYPNLKMLKAEYKEAMIPSILEEQNDLISEKLSEAEQEVLTFLQRQKLGDKRVTVQEVLKNFRQGNYGWPDAATLCLMARLFRRHKTELKRGSDVLDQDEVTTALCNSANHGDVFVQIQEEFDAATVTALKNFHHDFFHQSNPGNDAKSASKALLQALNEEAAELDTLIAQKSDFPFVETLEPVRDRLREIATHDYTYPLKSLRDFDDDLLVAKDDFVDPIKNFVNGTNGESFRAIADFLRDQASNLSHSDEKVADLRAAVDSKTPFRGGIMTKAVSALDLLKKDLAAKLKEAQTQAIAEIEEREKTLKSHPQFSELSDDIVERILGISEDAKNQIRREKLIPVIGDTVRRYQDSGFASQLARISSGTTKYKTKAEQEKEKSKPSVKEDEIPFIPIRSLIPKAAEGRVVLSNEEEVSQFLEALKKQLNEHVGDGKGVTL
ncbi:MAG: BREX system P-loop protein BrxC [Verrucomicrobiales bacterium]|nr:BREX system P-loop protein BrxC [Verrucomicrobiales bacterium]